MPKGERCIRECQRSASYPISLWRPRGLGEGREALSQGEDRGNRDKDKLLLGDRLRGPEILISSPPGLCVPLSAPPPPLPPPILPAHPAAAPSPSDWQATQQERVENGSNYLDYSGFVVQMNECKNE